MTSVWQESGSPTNQTNTTNENLQNQDRTTFGEFGEFVQFAGNLKPMLERAGDWLQPDGDLRNTYKGSEMLTCGRKVHDFSLAGIRNANESDEHNE